SVAWRRAGFGERKGSCDPVKVTGPELLIEGGSRRTQAGQLDRHVCAVTGRDERDLNECRCRRLAVGFSAVPFHDQAVRGIDLDVAARDNGTVEVKVECVPGPRGRHEMKRWMASLAWS